MNTLEKVNVAILLATITHIIAINSPLSGADQIGPGLRWFITFLTSVSLFRLLIILVYWIIRASDTPGARYSEVRPLLETNELSNRRTSHGSRLHATVTSRTP